MLKGDRNLPEHGVKVVQSFKEAQWEWGPIVMSAAVQDAWLDWHSICDLRSTDGRTGPTATSACSNRGFLLPVTDGRAFLYGSNSLL